MNVQNVAEQANFTHASEALDFLVNQAAKDNVTDEEAVREMAAYLRVKSEIKTIQQQLAAAREALAKKDSMLGEAPCRGLNDDGNLRCLTTANLAKCAERVATTLEMPTLVKQSRSNPNAGFIDWRDWQALKSEVFDLRAAIDATLQRDRQL